MNESTKTCLLIGRVVLSASYIIMAPFFLAVGLISGAFGGTAVMLADVWWPMLKKTWEDSDENEVA